MMTSCGRFTGRSTDREERYAVRKPCASAVTNSGRSIQTLTVAQKRKAPLYWDVHTEPPPVSFSLFYTLPLILSKPVLSYTEQKINPTCPWDHTRYPTFRIGTAFRPSATQMLSRFRYGLNVSSPCVAFPTKLTQLPFEWLVIRLSKTCHSHQSRDQTGMRASEPD